MPVLQGLSDGDDVPRELEVEVRGSEVYLFAHPPGNTQSGQEILVPLAALRGAIRAAGATEIAGVSPVRRTPKVCEVEQRPEGLRLQIHPQSRKGSWWVLVRLADLRAHVG